METKTAAAELVEDGESRDRKGRVRWPRERRKELVAEYERSGLTQAAFARRTGVRYPTFAHWVQERRRETASAMPPGSSSVPRFVELRANTMSHSASAELSITLPDGVVLRGADPSALAALARALRATGV